MKRKPKKKIKRAGLREVKEIRARTKLWGSEEYALYLSSTEGLQSRDRKLADDFLSLLDEIRLVYDAFKPDDVNTSSQAFSYIETIRQKNDELTAQLSPVFDKQLRSKMYVWVLKQIESALAIEYSDVIEQRVLTLIECIVMMNKADHESERCITDLYTSHVNANTQNTNIENLKIFSYKMLKNFK